MTKDEAERDAAMRNAGSMCMTVWADGRWLYHGLRDAEIATLCEPENVLLTVQIDTMEQVVFMGPQDRVRLYEKLLPAAPSPPALR